MEKHIIFLEKFYSVNDIIRNVCDLKSYDKKKLVKKIKSRVGQDFIYKLGSNMTMRELNWKPVYTLKKGLQEIMFYHKKYLNIFSKKIYYTKINNLKNNEKFFTTRIQKKREAKYKS